MYDAANFTLHEQVAVITGAGAGIGRAIAETFAAAGAAVVVSDRDSDTAKAVAKGIEGNVGKAAAMACDVTNEEDLARLVWRIRLRTDRRGRGGMAKTDGNRPGLACHGGGPPECHRRVGGWSGQLHDDPRESFA